jgi:hypothetical protein
VINKEDEDRQWLIEIYVDKSYTDLFTKLNEKEQEVIIEAIISRQDNDPASFITIVRSVSIMEDNMSILFNGLLVGRTDISKGILADIVKDGFHGNSLLEEYKKRVSNKKNTRIASK